MHVTFRPGPIADEIKQRAGNQPVGQSARRDLERYYQVLRDELAGVKLSQNEASLICDALNGTVLDERTYHLLWAEVQDAIRLDGLDVKWEVKGAELVSKLETLTRCQTLALVDAVERFWVNPNPFDEALVRARLVT